MIRKIVFAFAASLVLLAVPAMAQTTSRSGADSQSVAIIDNSQPSVTRSKGSLKTTGAAIAPGLTAAGVHSCAGSSTGALGAQGFAIALGSTYAMEGCERRANAATLVGLGQVTAAVAVMCDDEGVKRAMRMTGGNCPQDRVAQEQQMQRTYAASQGAHGSVVTSRGAVIRSATPWRD